MIDLSSPPASASTAVPLTSRPHFPILDGLRGVAALLVVAFHLFEAVYPDYAIHPIHHGYLAVDFFFLLSGFVVGYAYDSRWTGMTVVGFFKIRLTRLQPLVVLGVFLGLAGFLIDPYNTTPQGFWKIAATTLLGLALLPGPDIRGWGETHPLNGPCWSLLQEYIANVLYAVWWRRAGKRTLWIVVILAAAALVITAASLPNIGTGWSYATFWIACVRMLAPFTAGLLLFRTGRTIRLPAAFLLCSLALAATFLLPAFRYNGLYDAGVIIFVFPLIVAAGAGGSVGIATEKACSFLGRISYPVYILHYPFIYPYTAWVYVKKPPASEVLPVASGLFVLFFLLAWAALKWYDEPVRRWLKRPA